MGRAIPGRTDRRGIQASLSPALHEEEARGQGLGLDYPVSSTTRRRAASLSFVRMTWRSPEQSVLTPLALAFWRKTTVLTARWRARPRQLGEQREHACLHGCVMLRPSKPVASASRSRGRSAH